MNENERLFAYMQLLAERVCRAEAMVEQLHFELLARTPARPASIERRTQFLMDEMKSEFLRLSSLPPEPPPL